MTNYTLPKKLSQSEIELHCAALTQQFGELELAYLLGDIETFSYSFRKRKLNDRAIWLKYSIKLSEK